MTSRTLVRARDLAAFRQTLVELALADDPRDAVRRVVIVPTRAAAELLRRSIEAGLGERRRAAILPALLTRDEWIARLHAALPGRPRMLSRIEREVLLERAARRTASRPRMGGAPFAVRPGLVAALLDFYDELSRRQRTVRRFARVVFDQLRVERGTDRGSEGLLHQAAFMGLTFLAYEREVDAGGTLDEHALRRHLIAEPPPLPFDHIVIAVGDHPSDPRGLWPADFALLGRLRGLNRIDVVVTEETHDAGFRDRIEQELPGIVERQAGSPRPPGLLVRPPAATDGESPLCFVSRDREDELRDVARAIRRRAERAGRRIAPTAVVVHRPLPYLAIAPQAFEEAGLPLESFDALPLAVEPYAAMLDLVLTFARTGGTREAAAALLRSRLLAFDVDGTRVEPADVSALDLALAERRAAGEADTYVAEVEAWFGERETRERASRTGALRAATAAASARHALQPFREAPAASARVRALSSFIRAHEVLPRDGDPWRERHLRARAAVLGVLDELATAYATRDDAPRDHAAVAAAIHHAIEGRMFVPRRGNGAVQLVDAAAARFGDFEHVHVVGLVETDWPERTRRSIFFTSGLLQSLGWPQEADDLRAAHAAFRDLLGLAAATTTLHAFEIEGETVTAPAQLPNVALPDRTAADDRTSPEEGTPVAAPVPSVASSAEETARVAAVSRWRDARRARPPLDDRRYRGYTPPQPAGAYRVSAVDRYVVCPFKYFAATLLHLPEERDAATWLTPVERGTFLHELLERFYRVWEQERGGAIAAESMPDAIARFREIAAAALARLPAADRVLEETRLFGSIVARGLAERVFELEAEAGGRIVRRLIEYELRGPFEFPAADGAKTVDIRGKADRIDVFDDGTLRVIDYKLGALPDLDTSLQLAVYAHAARQRLERAGQRPIAIRTAAYLAFGDDRRLEGRLGTRDTPVDSAVRDRAIEFARAIERIEAGEFPARPRRAAECRYCPAAGVCRKEFAVEPEDDAEDAAGPV